MQWLLTLYNGDGGSDTRVLRIDANNNFVFSTNGAHTQSSYFYECSW